MRTRCLSIHAGYRCGHSGQCCSDVWAVPAGEHLIRLVRSRRLDLPHTAPLFVRRPIPAAMDADLVLAHHEGACVFYEREARRCSIHRQRGVSALPSSCRHFPRVFLRDGRGIALTLSHFCPTAARLLLDEVPISIVDAQPPLALDGDIEGFDATDTLPPLLHPEMLTDLHGYDAWEREALATFARPDLSHTGALSLIAAATDRVREWRPEMGPLEARVHQCFASASATEIDGDDAAADMKRLDLIDASCPADARPVVRRAAPSAFHDLQAFDGAVKRYLSARLFANWLTYRGSGLRSIVEWLRICLALLRNEAARRSTDAGRGLDDDLFVEAVRECDRILIHVADSRHAACGLQHVESTAVA